jgi:peptidyl-prolyl cis-trans isomerase C
MFSFRSAIRLAGTLFLLAATVVLPACSKGGSPADKSKGVTVAVVNGVKIGEKDVAQLVDIMQKSNFVPPDSTTKGSTPQEKQRNFAIERLIDRAVALQDARKAKIVPLPAEIDQQVSQFKAQMGAGDSLPAGLTADELRQNITDDLTINQYFEKTLIDKIQVDSIEVRQYFDSHPEMFQGQEQVHARHILFRVSQSESDSMKTAVGKKAQAVLEQVKKGQDFAELARKHSEDPGSGPNGGDLGFFGRGQMVKPFDDAVFSLLPGQTSGIVETPFGLHIIKVEERKAAEPLQLDAIRPQLEQFLKSRKVQTAVDSRLAELKAKAKIERKEASAR